MAPSPDPDSSCLRKPTATPLPSDVLCGRGGGTNHHIGNNHWRALVSANKRLYLTLPKRQKALVAKSIVHAIRSHNPPGGFLQKGDDGLWYDIGDRKACDKTSQALREGAPEIRDELREENSNGLGTGPIARAGRILPNGLIALDYSGVEAIDEHAKSVYNGEDGIVRTERNAKNSNKSNEAATVMPCGYGAAAMPFSEMSMMQAFQQFQAGVLPQQRPQEAVAAMPNPAQQQHQGVVAAIPNPAGAQQPPVINTPGMAFNFSRLNSCSRPVTTPTQPICPPPTLAPVPKTKPSDTASSLKTAEATAQAQIASHKQRDALLNQQPQPLLAPHQELSVQNQQGQPIHLQTQLPIQAQAAAGRPAGLAKQATQTQVPIQAKTAAGPLGVSNQLSQTQAAAAPPHQAHAAIGHRMGMPPVQAGQTKLPSTTQAAAGYVRLQNQAPQTELHLQVNPAAPQVQGLAPAAGLVGPSQQSLYQSNQNSLTAELAMREDALKAGQNVALSMEARLDNLRRIQQLENQTLLQRQSILGLGGAPSLGHQALPNRLGNQGVGQLEQQALLQRHGLLGNAAAEQALFEQARMRQHILGGADLSRLQNPTLAAAGLNGYPHNMAQAQFRSQIELEVALAAREGMIMALEHQRQQRNELAAITARELDAQGDEQLPMNTLEQQHTIHSTGLDTVHLHTLPSLSSLRSDLIPGVSGRWSSSLGHDQLLGLRGLTNLRGFSSLSQDELMNLRAACLAASEGTIAQEETTQARNDRLAEMAELWDHQRRQLAEVADEVANDARNIVIQHKSDVLPGTPEEKRQNSLDFLARAAEIAGRRNELGDRKFSHDSLTSSLSDENMTLKHSHMKKKEASKKKSIWGSMLKASKKISNLKPGKATQSLMESDSESSAAPGKKRKTRHGAPDKHEVIIQVPEPKKDTDLQSGNPDQNTVTELPNQQVIPEPTTMKKRKLNTSAQIEDDKSKQGKTGKTKLTAARSYSSDTPSTLSTSLAQFKAQQKTLIDQAVFPVQKRQRDGLLPTPLHANPAGSAPSIAHSLPLSEVSFKKEHTLAEGQFDDAEDEE